MQQKQCVSQNYLNPLRCVTERSETPSFQIIYFNSICACEKKIFDIFKAIYLGPQFQFLLKPQKFTCIDINTKPLVIQNETM